MAIKRQVTPRQQKRGRQSDAHVSSPSTPVRNVFQTFGAHYRQQEAAGKFMGAHTSNKKVGTIGPVSKKNI